jgi:hypothetical protein
MTFSVAEIDDLALVALQTTLGQARGTHFPIAIRWGIEVLITMLAIGPTSATAMTLATEPKWVIEPIMLWLEIMLRLAIERLTTGSTLVATSTSGQST